MSEITPTNSLLTAISQYTEARKSQGDQSKQTDEKLQSVAAERAAQQARTSDTQRLNVSSTEDVQKAQANVQKAETESPFRREAPNAGHDQQPVAPGQFVDIKV